jgi:hypothetical protein
MEEVEWSKDVWIIPSNLSILIWRLLLNRLPNEDNLIKRRDNIFVKLGNRFNDRLIRGTNNPTPLVGAHLKPKFLLYMDWPNIRRGTKGIQTWDLEMSPLWGYNPSPLSQSVWVKRGVSLNKSYFYVEGCGGLEIQPSNFIDGLDRDI